MSAMSVSVDGAPWRSSARTRGIFALDDICSHEYSLLSEGDVWAGEVYCQKHGSRFNLRTGAVTGLPATKPVETWDVKVENGEIWIARVTGYGGGITHEGPADATEYRGRAIGSGAWRTSARISPFSTGR